MFCLKQQSYKGTQNSSWTYFIDLSLQWESTQVLVLYELSCTSACSVTRLLIHVFTVPLVFSLSHLLVVVLAVNLGTFSSSCFTSSNSDDYFFQIVSIFRLGII